jgi:hypothetical protein
VTFLFRSVLFGSTARALLATPTAKPLCTGFIRATGNGGCHGDGDFARASGADARILHKAATLQLRTVNGNIFSVVVRPE